MDQNMNANIEQLLNTCLEIEGLLCLVARRGNGYPDNLIRLLKDKTSSLSAAVDSLRAENLSEVTVEIEENLPSVPTVTDEDELECDFNESLKEIPVAEDVVELTPDDPLDVEANIELSGVVDPIEHSIDLGEAPVPACLDEELPDMADSVEESPLITDSEGDIKAPASEAKVGDNPVTTRNDKVSVELTINDKFRFRRELFSNNDSELKEALQVAAEMSSVEEVEDYFYNDLCFDSESEVVKDFIKVVTGRFTS